MRHSAHSLAAVLAWSLVAALVPASAARAEGPQVLLGDSCVEEGRSEFTVPLILHGDVILPSTLRASILFDPQAVAPAPRRGRPVVEPGPALEGTAVILSHEIHAQAGQVDVVLNTQGKRPVPPLPAGTLVRIHLRLLPGVPGNSVLRLDLDPGHVRSLDGNGNEMFTAVAGPAYVWVGQTGPWLAVGGDGGHTLIEAHGELLRQRAWILRGRLGQRTPRGRSRELGPLEPVPGGEDGTVAADSGTPGPDEIFFYVAAQPDSAGRPMLGFGSDCRERMLSRQPEPDDKEDSK